MEHRFTDIDTANLPERIRVYQEMRFGMFVHWGLYAVPGDGEWTQFQHKTPGAEYARLAAEFNPTGFDAAEWVGLAKDAGQKYLVVTAKHHDGFCLWDTAETDFNIVKATPFGRDAIAELGAACERQGLAFGVYYSVKDWRHPDYPIAYTNRTKSHPDGFHGYPNPNADYFKYLDYMEAQLRELMTGYGPITALWFDFYGDAFADERERERGRQIIDMVYSLQPGCAVNDRLGGIGADFVTSEQAIPDGAPGRPWEACITVGDGWGYSPRDRTKDTPTLIGALADIAGKGGNLLLNVGPGPDGRIREADAESLRGVGRWLETNGEAIYGTTGGPNMRWVEHIGMVTRRPGREYLHVTDWPEDGRMYYGQRWEGFTGAHLLADPARTSLDVDVHDRGLMIHLPAHAPDPVDTVVVLEYEH